MNKKANERLPKLDKIQRILKEINDFYIGASEIINPIYLRRLKYESNDLYINRITLAHFVNILSPLIDTISDLVTKRDPIIMGFKNINQENITEDGMTLNLFIKEVTKVCIKDGLCFVAALSNSVEKKTNLKLYDYKDLMNFYFKNGELEYITFREEDEIVSEENIKSKNIFDIEKIERYITYTKNGGIVWVKNKNGDLEASEKASWVNSLGEVPIVSFLSGKEISKFEVISRFYDILLINKNIFNMESWLTNIIMKIADPPLIAFGLRQGKYDEGITLNSSQLLLFHDKNKDGIQYVEIKGDGINLIEKRIENMKNDINKLTFSLFEKTESRTVVDANREQLKSTGFLSDVAINLENGFNKLFTFLYKLTNTPVKKKDKIIFKKDFDNLFLNDKKILMYYDMLRDGNISHESFFNLLKENDLIDQNFDIQNELDKIKNRNSY